ncbi:MAG: ribonuclease PH [Actinobacteria bacterium]|nr:ribonuclease PH [Actinomycetota bacterium]
MRKERAADELRPLTITCDVAKNADGSALIKLGDTHVLCTAKVVPGVPAWLRGSRRGWLTAEYSMLPAATASRSPREAVSGRQSGRTQEIQRLIGRSLRAVTDMGMVPDRTIYIDCDVLQADGGTRVAAISGGYVALHLALAKIRDAERLKELPLFDSLAAVAVGVVDGEPLLDLDYKEDLAASVDMNLVVTGTGRIIEVQATAEGDPFERSLFDRLMDLGVAGAAQVTEAQTRTVMAVLGPDAHEG